MSPGGAKGELKVEEALKELDERLEQMRAEVKEISDEAKSGVSVASLRERLNDFKARAAQARQQRDNLKRVALKEATSTKEQLLHRRENLRKNLENVERTLTLRQLGKHRLRQLREKYVKELEEIEKELQSIAADR